MNSLETNIEKSFVLFNHGLPDCVGGISVRHSITLRSIRLGDIQLVPGEKDADGYDLIRTWPKFLNFLKQGLSLLAVAFSGCLSTADNLESWKVSVAQKLRYFVGC